jgi:hypothetical protein
MDRATKHTTKTTERLGQTVAALARLLDQTMNDLQMLDAEVQERIQQAENSLDQRNAERLRSAIEEAEQNARTLVAEELQARLGQQISIAVENARNEVLSDRNVLVQELEQLKQSSREWENERASLIADLKRASQLLEQSRDDHSRELAETDEAAAIALERQIATVVDRVRAESAAEWEAQRAHIEADRNRLREESEQARRLLAEATLEHSRMMAEVLEARSAAASPDTEASGMDVQNLAAEVARIEGLIQDISRAIEDPDAELSMVIRKNAERAELESYLRGVRCALPDR